MKTPAKTVKEEYEHRKQLTEEAKQRRDASAIASHPAGIAGGTEAQGESYFEARYEGEEANLNCREFHGPAYCRA